MRFKEQIEVLLELALEVQQSNYPIESVTSEQIEDATDRLQDYIDGVDDEEDWINKRYNFGNFMWNCNHISVFSNPLKYRVRWDK